MEIKKSKDLCKSQNNEKQLIIESLTMDNKTLKTQLQNLQKKLDIQEQTFANLEKSK